MKSLMCNLDGTKEALDAALTEAECFVRLCVLSKKQSLHMRLLVEELLGTASSLLALQDGSFWIEAEYRQCELHLTARTEPNVKERKKLAGASSTGKNEGWVKSNRAEIIIRKSFR